MEYLFGVWCIGLGRSTLCMPGSGMYTYFTPMFALRHSPASHESAWVGRRGTSAVRQLAAIIIALSFLFTVAVASASTRVDDGRSQHVSQPHATHAVSISSAEAPEIEENAEVDQLLLATYVMSVLASPSHPRVQHDTYSSVASSRRIVPLYIVAQQFLL